MTQKLSELLNLETVGTPTEGAVDFRTTVDPVFTIGPKVHGGSLQMIAVAAARQADALFGGGDPEAVPVAIASDFLSAPEPAEIDIAVRLRKRGRTVSVMTVDVAQNGRLMVASSVTLARRDTGTSHHSAPTILDDLPVEPFAEGIDIDGSPVGEVIHLGPVVDLVLDPATFPIAKGDKGDPVVRGWSRPRGGDADAEFSVLVCDISPPVVMNLALFGWAPTVQLTTYIRRDPAPGYLRFATSSVEVGPGMFEEDCLVVDSTGAVVAQSRQLALIPQRN